MEGDQLDPRSVAECGLLRPEPGRFSSLEAGAVDSVIHDWEGNEWKCDLARLG